MDKDIIEVIEVSSTGDVQDVDADVDVQLQYKITLLEYARVLVTLVKTLTYYACRVYSRTYRRIIRTFQIPGNSNVDM